MTEPSVRDRLTVLQARLGQPTPAPLEGQQAIDLTSRPSYEQPTLDEDDQP